MTTELSRYKVAAYNVAQIMGSRKQMTLLNEGLFHTVCCCPQKQLYLELSDDLNSWPKWWAESLATHNTQSSYFERILLLEIPKYSTGYECYLHKTQILALCKPVAFLKERCNPFRVTSLEYCSGRSAVSSLHGNFEYYWVAEIQERNPEYQCLCSLVTRYISVEIPPNSGNIN